MTDPMGSRSKLRLSVYFFGSPTLPSKATTLNLTKTAINNEKNHFVWRPCPLQHDRHSQHNTHTLNNPYVALTISSHPRLCYRTAL